MSDAIKNPPDGMPRTTAGVYYEDSATALEKAFGFKTRLKIPGLEGQIMHSELEYEDGLIFVGQACLDEKRTSPQTLDGAMTSGLYIYVDDVDAHCEQAATPTRKSYRSPRTHFTATVTTPPKIPKDTTGNSPSTSAMCRWMRCL